MNLNRYTESKTIQAFCLWLRTILAAHQLDSGVQRLDGHCPELSASTLQIDEASSDWGLNLALCIHRSLSKFVHLRLRQGEGIELLLISWTGLATMAPPMWLKL